VEGVEGVKGRVMVKVRTEEREREREMLLVPCMIQRS
jgi:hypothetical protein